MKRNQQFINGTPLDPRASEKQENLKKPEYFAIPGHGRDPHFNCTRSWYYSAEKQGLIRLIRVRGRGKLRGIVRVNFDEMAELFRKGSQ